MLTAGINSACARDVGNYYCDYKKRISKVQGFPNKSRIDHGTTNIMQNH